MPVTRDPTPSSASLAADTVPELTTRYAGAFDDDHFDPDDFDTDDATFVPDTPPVTVIVND